MKYHLHIVPDGELFEILLFKIVRHEYLDYIDSQIKFIEQPYYVSLHQNFGLDFSRPDGKLVTKEDQKWYDERKAFQQQPMWKIRPAMLSYIKEKIGWAGD